MLTLATGMAASAQQQTASWKYTLHPGDHLIYSEVLEKEPSGERVQQKARIALISHVLVLAESDGVFSVGTQRNRQSAELISYRENGKDLLQTQIPKFAQAADKIPLRTAESNEFSATGEAFGRFQVRREWPSRLLFTVHEIDRLPEGAVKPGAKWRGSGMLGLNFTYLRDESQGGELCALLDGTASGGKLRVQYWFGLSSGLLRRVSYFGEYATPFGSVRENLTLELKEIRHGESVEKWLGDPDARLAALSALERSAWVIAPAEAVMAIAGGDSGPARTAALGLLLRRGAKAAGVTASGSSEEQRVLARLGTSGMTKDPLAVPGDTYRAMESVPFRGYPYVMHVPQDYIGDRPFPLLIYLSGGPGFAIEGLNSSARSLEGSEFLVLYPNAMGMWWEKDSEKMVAALLDEVLAKFKIDPARVYLAGFSNGGTGTLHFASLWPEKFRGAVSLMGAGTCADTAVDPNKLTKLPLLLVHGEKDSIIPAQCSKDLFKALQRKSKQVRLEIFPDHDHDLTLDNDNGLTMEFIRKLEASATQPPK